jgi:DNA-binding CsgD family transcriptional regulator
MASLSGREREVLRLSADGRTVGEIADAMQISERTVTFHVNNAVGKLQARNKIHAVALAVRLGLLG